MKSMTAPNSASASPNLESRLALTRTPVKSPQSARASPDGSVGEDVRSKLVEMRTALQHKQSALNTVLQSVSEASAAKAKATPLVSALPSDLSRPSVANKSTAATAVKRTPKFVRQPAKEDPLDVASPLYQRRVVQDSRSRSRSHSKAQRRDASVGGQLDTSTVSHRSLQAATPLQFTSDELELIEASRIAAGLITGPVPLPSTNGRASTGSTGNASTQLYPPAPQKPEMYTAVAPQSAQSREQDVKTAPPVPLSSGLARLQQLREQAQKAGTVNPAAQVRLPTAQERHPMSSTMSVFSVDSRAISTTPSPSIPTQQQYQQGGAHDRTLPRRMFKDTQPSPVSIASLPSGPESKRPESAGSLWSSAMSQQVQQLGTQPPRASASPWSTSSSAGGYFSSTVTGPTASAAAPPQLSYSDKSKLLQRGTTTPDLPLSSSHASSQPRVVFPPPPAPSATTTPHKHAVVMTSTSVTPVSSAQPSPAKNSRLVRLFG